MPSQEAWWSSESHAPTRHLSQVSLWTPLPTIGTGFIHHFIGEKLTPDIDAVAKGCAQGNPVFRILDSETRVLSSPMTCALFFGRASQRKCGPERILLFKTLVTLCTNLPIRSYLIYYKLKMPSETIASFTYYH